MEPYYDHGGVVLYNADCRDVLDQLGDVGCILTDPPYSTEHTHGKLRHTGTAAPTRKGNGKTTRASSSRHADLGFESLDPELRRYCAEQFARLARRWVLVFSDVETCDDWRDDLVAAGLEYVRTGAWIKLGATPQFTGDRPASGFEAVTICHARVPERTGVGRGAKRLRWNGGGGHAVWSHAVVQNRSGRGGGVQRGGEGRWHTTQKPLALMHELVGLFADPGEIVLDPFAGSGTTLLACKNLGRRAIGVEVDEACCRSIVERLSQEVLAGVVDPVRVKST